MKKILFSLLFVSCIAFGQKATEVDLTNPRATVYTHIYFLQTTSYNPKKAAKTIYDLDEEKAIEAVIKIKRILDGKGLKIDFNRISNDSMYTDSISFLTQHRLVLFPDRMPMVSLEKRGEYWYYSSETIANIDVLYAEIFPWYIEKIQNIVPGAGHKKIFSIEIWQYIALLILLALAFVLFVIVKRLAFFFLKRILYNYTKKSIEVNDTLKKLAHPISLLFSIWLLDKVFPSLQFGLEINTWIFLAINIASTVFWIYVFLKLAQVLISLYHEYAQKTEGKLDDQLTPILRNFATVIIFIEYK